MNLNYPQRITRNLITPLATSSNLQQPLATSRNLDTIKKNIWTLLSMFDIMVFIKKLIWGHRFICNLLSSLLPASLRKMVVRKHRWPPKLNCEAKSSSKELELRSCSTTRCRGWNTSRTNSSHVELSQKKKETMAKEKRGEYKEGILKRGLGAKKLGKKGV